MKHPRLRLLADCVILLASLALAVLLVRSGVLDRLADYLGGMGWIGVLFAGMLFTSAFTTAPAIAVLGTFSQTVPLPVLAAVGAAGAVIGDYLLFRFVRDRVMGDIRAVFHLSRRGRFFTVFRTRPYSYLVPLVGSLIIASPFPDELGVALLGISNIRNTTFSALSFVFNGVGILAIGWVAQSIR